MSEAMTEVRPMHEADGEMARLAVEQITRDPQANPRRYFGPEQADLERSIAAEGVVQAIVVRPDPEADGRYILIAGERRWRAAQAVGLTEIPALIRHVDAGKAYALSVIENIQRSDMSPIEEANAAREVIELAGGDQAEAQRQLGWSPNKMRSRLQLLHCADEVQAALTERKIKLGHAELLAGLPVETQRGTLKNIIDTAMPVSELAARVSSFSLEISQAIFDTADCRHCPHNSSEQGQLFDTAIGEGRCTNRACFFQKTDEAIEAKREALKAEHNCVMLDRERRPTSYTPLVVRGQGGVGPEQAAACKGCAHYGALMITEPGREGQVTTGLCFDLKCNTQKAGAFEALFSDTQEIKASAETQSASSAPRPTPATATKPKASASANAQPKRVREGASKAVLEATGKLCSEDRRVALAVSTAQLVTRAGADALSAARAACPDLPDAALSPTSTVAQALPGLLDCSEETLLRIQQLLAQGYFEHAPSHAGSDEERSALSVIRETGLQMDQYFSLTKDYLKRRTKSGLEALFRDAGFDKAFDSDKGKGAFDKLMKQKVDEIIDTAMSAGFSFKGYVPEEIRALLPKRKV